MIANTDYVSSWKSKGLFTETIKPPATYGNSLTPAVSYYGTRTRVKFNGSCLKQPNVSYTHGKVINIDIVYELGASASHFDDPTLKSCLFGEVTLTKNADIDTYHCSGHGIGFDRKRSFLFPRSGFGQNVITFGADMSFSVHVDNKGKDILILGSGLTQGLGEYSSTAEKMYLTNFTVTKKSFV